MDIRVGLLNLFFGSVSPQVIYTCCSRGYVKVWYLTGIDFSHTATKPIEIPGPSTFRAHHESIVSLALLVLRMKMTNLYLKLGSLVH